MSKKEFAYTVRIEEINLKTRKKENLYKQMFYESPSNKNTLYFNFSPDNNTILEGLSSPNQNSFLLQKTINFIDNNEQIHTEPLIAYLHQTTKDDKFLSFWGQYQYDLTKSIWLKIKKHK